MLGVHKRGQSEIMYIPSNMKMETNSEAHDFIDEFSFGIIVSESLSATHLPFVLEAEQGSSGVLYSHFAKANPHWQEIDGTEVLVIFNGPHGYISPSWYAQGPAVPTWNYVSVHVFGTITLLDENSTIEVVEQAMQKYDPSLLSERKIVTNEFRDKLLSGIVGFKLEISRIEGKLKLGQHRKPEDQLGVYQALTSSQDLGSQNLANYMNKLALGVGS
jgi:transcriptional regulator